MLLASGLAQLPDWLAERSGGGLAAAARAPPPPLLLGDEDALPDINVTQYREQAAEMFSFGWSNYMEHAFPRVCRLARVPERPSPARAGPAGQPAQGRCSSGLLGPRADSSVQRAHTHAAPTPCRTTSAR